ncbi:4-alpha-glucanotransferase [Halomonas sp. 707D7]|uniref:4-alpha-glucanotransferase n=2 Tax=unclassified Halomonas TaxID=2609666 RepID=UPI00209CBA99|nr:4-alpha-glucanotransferase [Halomonas sp. 707D7]MCP1313216.1 4-alpha-glucanotransferase [Halomonas sp. 707D7]
MSTALHDLSRAAGLLLDWEDSDGVACRLSDAAQHRLLNHLGFPTESAAAIADSRRRLEKLAAASTPQEWPPLVATDVDHPIALPSPLPAGTPFSLVLESGERRQGRLDDQGRVPAIAVFGYHELAIEQVELTLAVAPSRCFTPADAAGVEPARLWGAAVQLYALRREGDGGLGDTQALAECARLLGELGADALAISPTHAMFSAAVEHYSPYSPSSRLLCNVLHCAPETLLGQEAVTSAQAQSAQQEALSGLEAEPLVDWPAAARSKLAWLRFLYDDFIARDDDTTRALRERFQAFCHAGGTALALHCRFEALQQTRGAGDWHAWPEALRDAQSDAVEAFAQAHTLEVSFHAFLQWLVADGLDRAQHTAREAGMAVGLIADLAVGVDPAGSQTWSRPAEMLDGLSIGAPPDLFNAEGQNWGLAAFSPWGLARSGFQSFIDMLRAGFAHAGGLRIDHVLGLSRLWLVPQGAPASDGGYLRYPSDALLRLVALESWRHRAIVIGEDLGTVEASFRDALAARGVLGMQVLWFEQDEDGGFLPGPRWSPRALATTTTHDLPTVAGWWAGRDIEWRARLGLLKPEQSDASEAAARRKARRQLADTLGLLHSPPPPTGLDAADMAASTVIDACLDHLAATPAPLALIPVEDLLGLEEQPNLPNSDERHPNWRRRLSADSATLFGCPETRQRLERLTRARREAPEGDTP